MVSCREEQLGKLRSQMLRHYSGLVNVRIPMSEQLDLKYILKLFCSFLNFFLHNVLRFLEKLSFETFVSKLKLQKLIHDSWNKIDSFLIAISHMSDIRLYHSKFLVKDLDEYDHLEVSNVPFWKFTSELWAFEIGQTIIISQLRLLNFRIFHFLKNYFPKSCEIK